MCKKDYLEMVRENDESNKELNISNSKKCLYQGEFSAVCDPEMSYISGCTGRIFSSISTRCLDCGKEIRKN